MEVQILSRETIKPSSPTPHHQRTYKLSLLDQLLSVFPVYVPLILFYSADPSNQNLKNRSHQLKDSLSKTLTYFYPFAGRLKDGFTIDCNDEGATYIETEVASDISIALQEADVDLLLQLLPCDPYENLPEPTARVMLAIQVNYFACGGLAIGVCISHVLADASAAVTFLNSWAAVASGANPIIDNVIYDSTSLFTPQDFSSCSKYVYECLRIPVPEGTVVMKRFLFDGSKLTSLRNEIGNASRSEAISALIWFAMLAITRKCDEADLPSVATMVFNLRKIINPPLPQQCIGNITHLELVKSSMEKTINLKSLVGKIQESIRKVDDEYIRKLHADGEYLDKMRHEFERFGKNWLLYFISFCKFPLYEIDFGWGKPIWLVPALKLNRIIYFLDTRDGNGIEAWIALSPEEMTKLEQDPGILTYATFKPSN
ncbi:hypothetical protein REPUB_Repub08aG0210800 [Reevesia pubescens]